MYDFVHFGSAKLHQPKAQPKCEHKNIVAAYGGKRVKIKSEIVMRTHVRRSKTNENDLM